MFNINSQQIPIDPDRLKSMQLWIMADKINRPLGSEINVLKDYSIFGNDMRVPNNPTGPTKVPNLKLIRGCPVPCLDMSVSTMLTHTTIKSLSRVNPMTLCVAFSPGATGMLSGNNQFITTVAAGLQISIDGRTGGGITIVQQSVISLGTITWAAPFPSLLLGQIYVLTLTLGLAGATRPFSAYLNGKFLNTINTSNVAFSTGTFTLGGNDWGYLFELMFFDDILSQVERERIEQYLGRKYSVSF